MNQHKLSKFLSLILRHKPEEIGIELDEFGWADIEELLAKTNEKGMNISIADIKKVVKESDKQRFKLSDDFTKIRANQGHSIEVNLKLKAKIPPEKLFHGTALKNVDSIQKNGILKGNRQHVHLSADTETAKKVGIRHGKPIIFEIDTKAMLDDNLVFFQSENGVWLTEFVAAKFLKILNEK